MRRFAATKLGTTTAAVALGIAGAGAAFAGTPGLSQSAGLGSQSASLGAQSAYVPAVSTPSTCGLTCNKTEVSKVSVATPSVAAQQIATPALSVPASWAGALACTGGFTIPARLVAAATPAVGAKTVTTPAASVPAVCSAWPCRGTSAGGWNAKLTPAVSTGKLTPPVWVTVALSPLEPSAGATSTGGRLAGPIRQRVNVAGIGPIELTLFPEGIDAPVDAALAGSLTLKVHVGPSTYGTTVPIAI